MLFNPLIAILHNEKLDRWHPILFQEAPLPGPPSRNKPIRHKSAGHHTEGFATREEAVAHAKAAPGRDPSVANMILAVDEDLPWDGEGIPAGVNIFPEAQGR